MAKDLTPAATASAIDGSGHRQKNVADALTMLDYAVGSGIKSADGHPIPQDIVTTIEGTAAKLGLLDAKPREAAGATRGAAALSTDDWAKFDLAFYDLAIALTPVTAETLRNTAGKPPGSHTMAEFLWGDSPAVRYTRKLWVAALVIAIVVILSNWYLAIIAVDGDTNPHLLWRTLAELLTPWLYGGLGACVYLLRSAHMYIYQRTFDIRRKPEYTNRVMLGAIAGGAIIMFTNNIVGDDGTAVQLSSAALGFLAGYNTDLLFSAMERVINALLPKIGLDTVQKASPTIKPADINAIVDHAVKADSPEKDQLHALAAHLAGMRAHKGKNKK